MLAKERHDQILRLLHENGAVQTGELCRRFGVAGETLRKDFMLLESKGLLMRTHGGAVTPQETVPLQHLEERQHSHLEQKHELCRLALRYIHDGDSIVVGCGSTGSVLAKILAKESFHDLTVMTHSLEAWEILKGTPGIRLILTGGVFLPEENSLYGQEAIDTIESHHFSVYFLCPSGISMSFGISDYIPEIHPLQRAYMRQASRTVVLADSSKFEKNAHLRICPLSPAYTLVTDSALDPEIRSRYLEAGLDLITE